MVKNRISGIFSVATKNLKLLLIESSTSKSKELRLTLVNAFLVFLEKNWSQNWPSDFKAHYCRQYVDDIFALFTSPEQWSSFRNFLNDWHARSKTFLLELEESLLIIREKLLNRNITSTPLYLFDKPEKKSYLLEFYFVLIIAMLFLLNRFFIILSFVSVWTPLFTLMVLFNLLSPWSLDWTLPLLEVVIRSLQYLYLNFSIIKVEKTRPKHHWNKIWDFQICCDFCH